MTSSVPVVERADARAAPCARRRSASASPSTAGRCWRSRRPPAARSRASTHRAASAAVKPAMPLPSVSRLAMRMTGPSTAASASLTPRTSSGGIRLVKKLPGPMMTASKLRIASATVGWMPASGSSHSRWICCPPRLPRVHLGLAARSASRRRTRRTARPRSTLTGHTRPRHPRSAAQAVHAGEEVAAVLLHHRQQQVAAGVAGEPGVMLERRQARQEHAPRLAFVARQRQRALQHVAGRQHAELVAELARTAAAVEHRDHGVERAATDCSSNRRAGSAGRCRLRNTRR